jgi:hypothetical protein
MNIEEYTLSQKSSIQIPFRVINHSTLPNEIPEKSFIMCLGKEHPLTLPPPKLPFIGGENPLFSLNHW